MTNWRTKKLGEIMSFKNGLNKSSEYFGHGTKIINYKDVYKKPSLLEADIKGLVDVTNSEKQNSNVQAGDVFFTRTSETLEEIGLSSVLLENVEDGVFSGYVLRGRPLSDDLLPEYCRYLFRVSSFRKEIKRKSSMTTRALTSGKFLSEVIISFPKKPEQQRIVGVLKIWDEYIEKLEQKIALKEQLKKGLMQQLLTGKRRLPGSIDKWREVQLGEVLEKIEGGGTPSKEKIEYWNGSIPWASVKDIVTHDPSGTRDHISKDGLASSSSRLVEAGTLITPTRMALGHAVFFDVEVAINQDLKALHPTSQLDKKYLFYWFQLRKKAIQRLGTGSTVAGIQLGELRSLKINLPPVSEQAKIVDILDVSDREIERLKSKAAELKKQKKYLLKNLITGKIRTPENLKPKGAK